MINRC